MATLAQLKVEEERLTQELSAAEKKFRVKEQADAIRRELKWSVPLADPRLAMVEHTHIQRLRNKLVANKQLAGKVEEALALIDGEGLQEATASAISVGFMTKDVLEATGKVVQGIKEVSLLDAAVTASTEQGFISVQSPEERKVAEMMAQNYEAERSDALMDVLAGAEVSCTSVLAPLGQKAREG